MFHNTIALIVEDSATIRSYVSSVLKTHLNCHQIISMGNGLDACRMVEGGTQRIDWIFSDWEMPGVRGDEFLKRVRQNPATAKTPFIMITGRNDKESLMAAIEAGVTDYLVKPFTATALVQKIRRVLSLQERRSMERYLSLSNVKVEIRFSTGGAYQSSLVNLSMGGFLTLAPVFRAGSGCIYDIANVAFHFNHSVFSVKAELMRVENCKSQPESDLLILAAFKFMDLDETAMENLSGLIKQLKALSDEETSVAFAE
ncbi:MAG: response regulator [Nitrospinae bacterium]|nr:response regulator [Nitrospinota bacterium]